MTEVQESWRPSLVKLGIDVDELEKELLTGFDSRSEVLYWLQRLTVRTLGEIPTEWYVRMGNSFRGAHSNGTQTTMMGVLLTEGQRQCDLSTANAVEIREEMVAQSIAPAFHRAYRSLRKDAGDYVASSAAGDRHSPGEQQYIAMRPVLDEMDENQERALQQFLEGFEDRAAVIEWGGLLEHATHGEMPESFIPRLTGEKPTTEALIRKNGELEPLRELLAAKFLVPMMNQGVRDLAGRTGELPEIGQGDDTEAPDW